jgi:transposase
MALLVEEMRLVEVRIAQLERELTALTRQSPACTTLLSIRGVGLLTAAAMGAATSGSSITNHLFDERQSCNTTAVRDEWKSNHTTPPSGV